MFEIKQNERKIMETKHNFSANLPILKNSPLFQGLSDGEILSVLPCVADKLLSVVGERRAEIIEKIESASHHYLENRIFPLDKCVLMIAVAEILYFDDKEIPPVVSVSEAVNLAKKYSGDTAADFVNGVLSGIINKKTS